MSLNIGLVGKPNVGKSTFFSAATLITVPIANYPFTTIGANKGMTAVRAQCPCKEFDLTCEPKNATCEHGTRYVPVELIDVAGLIEGAHEGKGLGNKFLDDLRQASALIHVVDAAGCTAADGTLCAVGEHNPLDDIQFLENEISYWIKGILEKSWDKLKRSVGLTGEKFETALAEKLAGLGITESHVKKALAMNQEGSDELLALAKNLRKLTKPMSIAANKCDIAPAENLKKLAELKGYTVIPTSAEAEFALRRAASAHLIEYHPGDSDFTILNGDALSRQQRNALEYIRENVLKKFGSTGIQKCIEDAVYKLLDLIVVYPVEDENKLTDKNGHVLPDAILLKKGSTARDLAYKVHTDLGEKFIRAIDARTKRIIGADHELENGSVVKIIAEK